MTDDLLEAFLIEGRELTARAGEDLAVLARAPGDKARLDRCFRAIHTLKGSVGLFDLPAMGRLLHVAEDQLDALRRGAGGGESVFVTLVDVVDQVDRWLDDLERAGALSAGAEAISQALMARLAPQDAAQAPISSAGDIAIRYTPRSDSYFAGDDPMAIIAAVPGLRDLKVSLREPFGDLTRYDPFTCNLVIEAISTAGRAEVEAALRWVKDQVELSAAPPVSIAPSEAVESDGVGRTIRVEAARVDRLADLTGELVIAKNGLSELAAQVERLAEGHAVAQALRAQQARIDRLVADLHGTVSKVRLTALAPLFGRFPRLVRETARTLEKSVSFVVEGGEIEVDKAVVDGLFEPLLHVLRNALDHGVETPGVRRAAGKPETGVLRLSARTVGEQVLIEVVDDGAGIDPDRIRTLAAARGLISAQAAEALDDRGAIDLIFLPGFSTASTVSEVSGRGVGMDAVRTAVGRLGGRVDIQSRAGQGSTIRILLPISMVLTKVMVVACGEERYGLTLDHIVETTRVSADRIVPVRAGHAFQLRDQVIPLVRLGDLVGAPDLTERAAERVVVTRIGDELVGFSVDAIVERMDAAVRPMSGLLAGARGVVGSTLLANGAVLMILDLQELIP